MPGWEKRGPGRRGGGDEVPGTRGELRSRQAAARAAQPERVASSVHATDRTADRTVASGGLCSKFHAKMLRAYSRKCALKCQKYAQKALKCSENAR